MPDLGIYRRNVLKEKPHVVNMGKASTLSYLSVSSVTIVPRDTAVNKQPEIYSLSWGTVYFERQI